MLFNIAVPIKEVLISKVCSLSQAYNISSKGVFVCPTLLAPNVRLPIFSSQGKAPIPDGDK